MTGGAPVPGKENWHNAVAMAVGKRTQESWPTLIEAVCQLRRERDELRRQLDETRHGPDLFTAFDDREAS